MIHNIESVELSPNAEQVLRSRYLARDESGHVVETPAELFMRVARAVAKVRTTWGGSAEEVKQAEGDYFAMMASRKFMPNSPTLMNAGRPMGMLSACFVLPLEDSIEGIMQTATDIARVQKAGGGTGIDLSRLRPRGSIVASSGGTTEGPLSFLRMFSGVTDAIQQGAFRRGANMGVMRIDHPDILAFIDLKSDLSAVTNYNLSVAITDEFMSALSDSPDQPHVVLNPLNGEAADLDVTVAELWRRITTRAWQTGEPGLIFIDEINRLNTTPHLGAIRAVNPCGEQPLHENEACNLGSINLAAFSESIARNDLGPLGETVRLAVSFLDDVVEANKYPTQAIHDACHGNRRIGLGVMGFADLLYKMRIPYESEQARLLGSNLASFISEEGHAASEELAERRGAFPNWEGSTWDTVHGRKMRSAEVTTVAPTGTLSILVGCSAGIEPLFSLAFTRQVLDGQVLCEVNAVFEAALKEHTSDQQTIEQILEHAATHGTVQNCDAVPAELKAVFKTARDIDAKSHVRMQAAWQKHTDAAVSKTINLAAEATVEDVEAAYLLAHRLECKGITVYRDGCRANQPMALTKTAQPKTVEPIDLPELMPAVRVKQRSPLGNLHAQISVEPDTGAEREVFAQLGKAGELACADLEAICRLTSMLLRCGVELQLIVDQLQDIGSSLTLPSRDGRVMSLPDALARALAKYLQAKETHGIRDLLLGAAKLEQSAANGNGHAPNRGYKLKCPDCGGDIAFEEGCAKCHSCGFSQC